MKMKVLAALVALACASGFAVAQDKSKKSSGPKAVTVKLVPQNRSGESGSAKLTPMGEDKTQVEISLKGGPKGTPQPAHIHEGSCAKLNPQPKYPLQNVVDGKSTSEVPVGIAQLTKHPRFAERMQNSGHDLHVWTVNTEEELELCRALGARAVITDRPRTVLGWLDSVPAS